jgi:hypothetical protein
VPLGKAGGFPCPACDQIIRTSLGDLKLTWVVTLLLSCGTCVIFGYRSLTALFLALVASVPVSFIVHSLFGLVFPPPLECIPTEDISKKK